MLQRRSILLEICLLVVVAQIKCQNYDYAEAEDDHADLNDEPEPSSHPDYSKYYSVDNSAPIQGQHSPDPFITPIEFTSFFGPSTIAFGESNNKEVKKTAGFVQPPPKNVDPFDSLKQEFPEFYSSNNQFPADYYEQAQQKQKQEQAEAEASEDESSEIEPGPYYASYKVPSQHSDEVETIDVKKTKKNKKNDVPDYEVHDYDDNYTRGKSSTYSQYPKAIGLQPIKGVSSVPTTTLTPYQKYSFKPTEDTGYRTNYISDLISTVAPFNPNYKKVAEPTIESQSTENVPSHLKGCQKIKKPVSEAEAMDCYVCENANTKSKYTQCSYTSDPNPVNYYEGKSERYSTPARDGSDGFRYKRYTDDAIDPYNYIKKRSQQAYDEPSESEKYQEEYNYSPEHYDEEELEKSFSEQQSEELKKNPENCKKIEKTGMTCTVCKNEKTGGNYEQCSYTSEPKEKKYAYVTEKKYDSEEPEETKPVAQTKKPEKAEKSAKYGEKLNSKRDFEPVEEYEERRPQKKRPERNNPELKNRKPQQFSDSKKPIEKEEPVEENYDIPEHFIESTHEEKKKGGRGLDPKLYGGEEDSSDEPSEKQSNFQDDIEEYQFKLFPEFANEESRQEETHYPGHQEVQQHDVEEVLAEFTKKDRSNCKKAEKNGMTCYLCVDKNKIQHEECMYVSESRPTSTHVAYHEEKKIKKPEEVTPVPAESKRKRFFKKVSTTTPFPQLEGAASEEIDSIVRYSPKKVNSKKAKKGNNKKAKDTRPSASQYDTERIDEAAEPTMKTPQEFVVEDEGGAYSAETKPVYSKLLGVRLPRYMVEKSEFEKEFDEFSGAY